MDTVDHDPRVVRLPFGGPPNPTILIILAYLTFVTIVGPAWMRNKKPYDLRGLLIVHNFGLVIFNAWIFYKLGIHGWFWRYSWTCANIDYLETEDSLAIVQAGWWLFISKLIELGDTVFFVLRKKDSQITFLHVVHHGFVPLLIWYLGTVGGSGFNTLFGFINSFIHIWMYLYYGLAALGPSVQKHLWWKKYLTSLQIVQFCVMTLATIAAMVTPGCKIPWKLLAANLGTALFFLVLFANFYRHSYKSQGKPKSSKNGHSQVLNGDSGKLRNKLSHNH